MRDIADPGSSGVKAGRRVEEMRGAVSTRSPTRIRSGPSKRAWPRRKVSLSSLRARRCVAPIGRRDAVGARLQLRIIDPDVRRRDAEIGAAGEMGGISARHHRLGRNAAGVDAGPADEVALDQRHRHARPGQAPGQRRPGLAGADDDRVEPAFAHNCETIRKAPQTATTSSIRAAGRSFPKLRAIAPRSAAPT